MSALERTQLRYCDCSACFAQRSPKLSAATVSRWGGTNTHMLMVTLLLYLPYYDVVLRYGATRATTPTARMRLAERAALGLVRISEHRCGIDAGRGCVLSFAELGMLSEHARLLLHDLGASTQLGHDAFVVAFSPRSIVGETLLDQVLVLAEAGS